MECGASISTTLEYLNSQVAAARKIEDWRRQHNAELALENLAKERHEGE